MTLPLADIEGSTRLRERDASATRSAPTRQEDILDILPGAVRATLPWAPPWGAADATREAPGYSLPPGVAAALVPHVAAARSELGETVLQAARKEGRAMKEEQAIALAFGGEENDGDRAEAEPK